MKKGRGHRIEKGVEAAVQELLCALSVNISSFTETCFLCNLV